MYTKQCSSCVYFHVDAKNLKQGHCWRFPPTPFVIASPRGPIDGSTLPIVPREYGCGEYATEQLGDALPVLGAASAINGGAA